MSLRLLFLPAFLLCAFQALAQTYEPGLLVRANGDTLRGEIENGFWVEPPTFIRYRPSAASASQLFRPRQLRAVSFTNGRYFSYEALPIDNAAKTEIYDLPRGNYFDVIIDTVLADVLLDGPVPLRRVVRNGVTHYLLRGANQPVLDLSERKYLRFTPNRTWVVTDGNNYRNQLSLYFNDCPDAITAAQAAPFTAEGIVGVVQAFNKSCSADRQPTRSLLPEAKLRRNVSFQGGLLAGVRYNRIESASLMLKGPCVDCQPHPFAGLYGELFQPSRTVAIYGEVSFSYFKTTLPILAAYTVRIGDYRALLGTARLGIRRFFPMPHENQLVLGMNYELNKVMNASVDTGYAPEKELGFGSQTLLPGLELGWRSRRLTYVLSGTMYDKYGSGPKAIEKQFFSTNYVVRANLGYRLSGNPDAVKTSKAARP
ncbi:hypothetical protein [Hymenobacter arizonensis]|uniref:Outer membrane protein beta-barrel domain-containing protein n=1 Tax=Hymenobacter arizonensis TaxID=1227077 RepID=A0A1I5Z903_HYMAR|nr:hypothetical protein [Hymenobacter arizonensis]SFQ52959.1 hypothetical protein SAMN04515668_2835 [Hymenobacter arizonensis]